VARSGVQVSHETIYAPQEVPMGKTRSTCTPGMNCAASSSRVCGSPVARACHAFPMRTTVAGLPTCPACMSDRLRGATGDARILGRRPDKGAGNRWTVGVLVGRTSRLVLLAKTDDVTAASAPAGFSAKLDPIAAPMRQRLTYDEDNEMARHARITAAADVRPCFCDPHRPWQRGSCDGTDGLLRQYLPRGTGRADNAGVDGRCIAAPVVYGNQN
jgi:transposase, IS30 family